MRLSAVAAPGSEARQKVLQDMELWTEIRRRVLTGELSRRQAAREYELNYRTVAKVCQHAEPPGYQASAARHRARDGRVPARTQSAVPEGDRSRQHDA